jgi:hypothetical protein
MGGFPVTISIRNNYPCICDCNLRTVTSYIGLRSLHVVHCCWKSLAPACPVSSSRELLILYDAVWLISVPAVLSVEWRPFQRAKDH